MGTFRLILAFLVVGSHVAGLGDAPSGGTGIVGFFTISGFLMAKTITENYAGNGIARFYLNRVIRIAPPFIAVAVASAGFLWLRDSAGFVIKSNSLQRYMPIELPSSAFDLIGWSFTGFPLFLRPSANLLPQAWSLATEGVFYLVAPFVVMLMARRRAPVVWLLSALALALTFMAIQTDPGEWVRSPAASLWIFNAGVLAYFARPLARLDPAIRRACLRWSAAPLVVVVAMGIGWTGLPQAVVFVCVPFLVIVWLILGDWSTRRGSRIDRAAGNLAYGVFLIHYLSTLFMMWIGETVYRTTGIFGIFGEPELAHVRWVLWINAFALAGGALVYWGVEHPLERVRARVRRAVAPGLAHAAASDLPLAAARTPLD